MSEDLSPAIADAARPVRIAPPTDAIVVYCPLCERELSLGWQRKSPGQNGINGVTVCRRCRKRFLGRRQFAYLSDFMAWSGIPYAMFSLFSALAGEKNALPLWVEMRLSPRGAGPWIWMILVYLLLPLLFCMKDGFGGYSLGKWLMGLQVVDRISREPVGMGQSIKRNLVLMLPYLGTLLVIATMAKGRRLGDGWAETEVIWRKYKSKRPFEPRANICHDCGYDLTGNVTGRCSECGRPVNSPG